MHPDKLKPKRNVTRWTTEELDDLAHRVHHLRSRRPQLTLVQLVNRAQATNWARPRKIVAVASCTPIASRLVALDAELAEKAAKVPGLYESIASLRDRPAAPAATLEELVRRFSAYEILAALAKHLGPAAAPVLPTNGHAAVLPQAVPVAFVGFQPHYRHLLKRHLPGLEFEVSRDGSDVADESSVVLWADNVDSGASRLLEKRCRVTYRHRGTFSDLLPHLDRLRKPR